MLKSFCIKTNNSNIINYLLESIKSSKLENVYISNLEFKFYKNIIIHYKGCNIDLFYKVISEIITNTVLLFYEQKIVKNMLNTNYFYFSEIEQYSIFKTCMETLKLRNQEESLARKDSLYLSIYKYISSNKYMLLDGFVTFRIKEYIKILDLVIDLSVNKFVVDKEYHEFIDLLKLYVNSKSPSNKEVHLIYKNKESILLDENKNLINAEDNIFEIKYLSDISFSSNDFALSTLLSLLPKKIIIHIIDNEDEFINTLKLIFDKRIYICTDCKICEMYNFASHTSHFPLQN